MRNKPLPKTLTPDELVKIKRQCDIENPRGLRTMVIIELAHGAGLRVSEICKLRPEHINYKGGLIEVRGGKGGVDRVVPVDESTMGWLVAWNKARYQDCEWFLHNMSKNFGNAWGEDGAQMKPRHIQQTLKRLGVAAGLSKSITPHMFRHTYATELLNDGFNIREVQELLGHANIRTTEIYLHVNPQELREKIKKRHRG